MDARLVCLVLALQMAIWASATSRPFAPNHALLAHLPGQRSDSSSQAASFTGPKLSSVSDDEKESKLGSSPPSCAHKCNGCSPCKAIQVPATSSRHGHTSVGLQYTNYEPEGWKCKCGPSLYSP